jgi:hemoglobin
MTEPIMKIDHISEDGIQRLVDEFYARVRADTELAPIFNRAIPGDWGLHLATMRDFWSSVMLTSGRYKGNPVAVHLRIEGMAAPVRPLARTLRRNVRRTVR